MKKVIITSVIAFISIMAMAQDKKVAVFDPAGSVSTSIREIVREEISSVVVNALGYTVLERSLISKVLEENKFQSGGLVDDSQISEIGKRMGANLVLVSSLTIMENGNYYISCKMIDVLTARIEKQKTARTLQGSNDLINVVGKMVGEMFLDTQKSSENQPQTNVSNNQKKNEPQPAKKVAVQPPAKPSPVINFEVISCRECGVEIMSQDLYLDKVTLGDCNCPDGWRLPTRQELFCICRAKKKIGNLKTNNFSFYFTREFDRKGNVYVLSFDHCKETVGDVNKVKAWVRCVR